MLSPSSVDGAIRSGTKPYRPLLSLVVGGAAGGFLVGVLVGLLVSAGPQLARGLGLSLVVVATIAALFPHLEPYLPERRQQVAAATLQRHSPATAALRWGMRLGLGLLTYRVTIGLYFVFAVALLQPTVPQALAVCISYGFGRALTIAVLSVTDVMRSNRNVEAFAADGRLKSSLRLPIIVLGYAAVAAALL